MTKLTDLGLAELQVFDVIYEVRSVVETSRILNISQPTTSRWLAKLRVHFGDPLFVRTARGMEPTSAAHALAAPVREMLDVFRDRIMRERAFDPAVSRREFRIAASDFGQFMLLPRLDDWASEEAPHARFRAVPLGRGALPEGLATGEIDVAVGAFPALSSGVIEQTLYEDDYVCVVRKGHPLAERGLSWDAYHSAQHILVSARTAGHIHDRFEQKLLEALPPENVRLTSYSFSLAPLLIGEKDYILTVPRRVAELFKTQLDLVMLTPPVDLPRFQVKQYWHERSKHDPGHQWLRQGIVNLLGHGSRRWKDGPEKDPPQGSGSARATDGASSFA